MAATCTIVDLPISVLPQVFAALAEQPDSLPDLCCCLCVCKQWNEAVSCRQLWRYIHIPRGRADKLTSTDLEKLVARSSDQVLSLNLSGCNKVRTYTIMQVLLSNQQLEEVDLSHCFQVGVHNVEFFLQNVLARPSPKLKQLTVSYRFRIHRSAEQEAQAAGILVRVGDHSPRRLSSEDKV